MIYKMAICDDQVIDRKYIQTLVEQWAKEESYAVQIESFSSGEAFLFAYESKKYDLLLLDIEMEQMDGVTLAKKIRQKNDGIPIIFISGYSDYLAEGYDVAALHYLLKPIKEEKLFEVLNRGIEQVEKAEQLMVVESGGITHSILLKSLRYVEVQSNYVTLHGEESYRMKKSLKEIEEELNENFYRIHRSYIVQLFWIQKATRKEVILKDGTNLPLARGKYEELNQQMIRLL